MFEEIFAWVLTSWHKNEKPKTIEVREFQTHEIEVLARQGFAEHTTYYSEYFDLQEKLPEKLPLENGFQIIDMGSTPEFRRQRILRAHAFEGQDNLADEEIERQLLFYNNTHRSPTYHGYTNLCVRAEDGTHISSCEALINPCALVKG